MASKKKNTKVLSSKVALISVDNAIAGLIDVASKSINAIAIVDKNNKKLAKEAKRLSNKRAILSKKKKAAAKRLKKDSNATNKKALKAIDKEITSIKKQSTIIAAQKEQVAEELSGLKLAAKRATAYNNAVTSVDKKLNKPKSKRRKKPVLKSVELVKPATVVNAFG